MVGRGVRQDREGQSETDKGIQKIVEHFQQNRAEEVYCGSQEAKRKESFRFFAASLDIFVSTKYVWNGMNVFKNRENTRKWNLFENEEFVDTAKKEMNKVAPSWMKNKALDLRGYQDNSLGLTPIFIK